jgi:hypothetical protein
LAQEKPSFSAGLEHSFEKEVPFEYTIARLGASAESKQGN